MKILGFVFGRVPNVSYHIDHITNKFNSAVWSLNHLKRSNISKTVMVEVYKIMLRPIIEFCGNVYHAMLTNEMTERLESLQRRALRIIFGFEKTYAELLSVSNLEKLHVRRERMCLNFALKLTNSPRFSKWFPTIEEGTGPSLRNRKIFKEEYARTSRLYNSPIFYMRRKLNEHFKNNINDEDTQEIIIYQNEFSSE